MFRLRKSKNLLLQFYYQNLFVISWYRQPGQAVQAIICYWYNAEKANISHMVSGNTLQYVMFTRVPIY